MSVTVKYAAQLEAVELLETNATGLSSKQVTHGAFNTTLTSQTAASTPAVAKAASGQVALISGAKTLDLTSLAGLGVNGATVVGSGRVAYMKVQNPASNANVITVAKGASSGYDGFGAAFSYTINPGGEATFAVNGGGSVIGSGNKALDFSGTAVQPFNILIVMG